MADATTTASPTTPVAAGTTVPPTAIPGASSNPTDPTHMAYEHHGSGHHSHHHHHHRRHHRHYHENGDKPHTHPADHPMHSEPPQASADPAKPAQ